jgi:hypothetical protein
MTHLKFFFAFTSQTYLTTRIKGKKSDPFEPQSHESGSIIGLNGFSAYERAERERERERGDRVCCENSRLL